MKKIDESVVTAADVLVCFRISDLPTPRVRVPAVVGWCEECDAKIWVALSSPTAARRWCLQCAAPSMRGDAEVIITSKQAADADRNRGGCDG